MGARRGFTLVETLLVVAILCLAAALLLPGLTAITSRARLVTCASQVRGIHTGLMGYAAAHEGRLPPFAFSDWEGNLPLSGHWGGASELGVEWVNLWVLVRDGHVPPALLVCTAADQDLRDGKAGWFPYTHRFSTYCLRMPPSRDLFRRSPELIPGAGSVLGVYQRYAGNQPVPGGAYPARAPAVRIHRTYRIDERVACGDGDFAPAADALLSDAFWYANHEADAPATPGVDCRPVRAHRCHGELFNVLYGDGSVSTVADDGTVRRNTVGADGAAPPGQRLQYAAPAERVWQFFDGQSPSPQAE
jgi:prepilin-type N-terminal cleavage/methylation domain-containing protein/prepilin-type processing-associated H-X9-DG protein